MVTVESAGEGAAPGGDPLTGVVLGDRYQLGRPVEDRGARQRFEARHTLDGRVVDVELVRANDASGSAFDRFLETSRIVARVGHENVVPILNGGRAPGGVYVAVEHLDGPDLERLLGAEPPLPWDRAQTILVQAAAALGALHKHGVVHGGLRADSVRLFTRGSRRDLVALRDFGVAALDLTASAGVALDPRDDVRALGALAYQMVTGIPAAPADAPPPPTSQRPAGTLPAELDAVLLRALDADPERRWPDMPSFAEALARCRLTRRQSVRVEALVAAERSEGNRTATDAFETAAHRRHRAWSVASVAAGVLLAILGLRILRNAPGHVHITTVPTDAELVFNDLPVPARSPVVLDASPGHYILVVARAGFVTAAREVEVEARATVDLSVVLVPAAPPTVETQTP